jgi:SpoVK/Ycf46/Vps4 family AAA+-type ATPase
MEVIGLIIVLCVVAFFVLSDKGEETVSGLAPDSAKVDLSVALSLINATQEIARYSLREVKEKLDDDRIKGKDLDEEIDQYRKDLEGTISAAEKNKSVFTPEGKVILKIPDFDDVRKHLHTEMISTIQAATSFSTYLVLSKKKENENLTATMFIEIAKIRLLSITRYFDGLSMAKYINKADLSESAKETVLHFLVKIACNDKKISDLEIKLLNSLYDKEFSKDEYMRRSSEVDSGAEQSDKKYTDELTKLLSSVKDVSDDCAKLLYVDIKELALTLIAIDEDRDEEELQVFTEDMHAVETILYPKTVTTKTHSTKSEESLDNNVIDETIRKSLNELTEELENLIGLEGVKHNVMSLLNMIRVNEMRNEMGMAVTPVTHHLVFTGNPGTGKTTVARLLAGIYRELGILSKGHLTEVSRHSLVAGYVGQTAIKTQKVIDKSMGGILFIDEAYSLAKKDSDIDYGSEAIETLLKAMEDKRRDFIVIAAGYPSEMSGFINSNPGLKSRFTKYIQFDDYSADELFKIFLSYVAQNGYTISSSAGEGILNIVRKIHDQRGENFGNARAMRTLFESIVQNHSNRVISFDKPTEEQLQSLTLEDVPALQSSSAYA